MFESIMRILNFQRWKLAPSNFSMTFKDSIWKENILSTKARTNTLKLETWYFQKLEEQVSHLKNLQHFEEISSTPPTHLERLLLSLQPYKLKAFPQKDSPFLCYTSKTFDYFLF